MISTAFGVLCPDCGSTTGLHADPSCPTARGVDDITADDAAWFRAHPHASERRRATTPAEVAETRRAGVYIEITDTCVVTQLAPGVRTRRFEYAAGGDAT